MTILSAVEMQKIITLDSGFGRRENNNFVLQHKSYERHTWAEGRFRFQATGIASLADAVSTNRCIRAAEN